MPIDYSKYVGWWHQFSEYIRFERAGNLCECEGECGYTHDGRCTAQNGVVGKMGLDGIWRTEKQILSLNSDWGMSLYGTDSGALKFSKVCLTVAHLDHAEGICRCKIERGVKCAIPAHCKAMCNFCHLMMDLPHHIENRRQNLMRQKDAQRGLLQL